MDLSPAPHFVGVFPNHGQHSQEVVLKIREKKLSWSGDDFHIKVSNCLFRAEAFAYENDCVS